MIASEPVLAAEIVVDRGGDVTVISVLGKLDPSDGQKFADAISDVRKAIVLFASSGGSLGAGLRIGKIIRQKNFATAVPDGVRCASACALAWLGGATRLMGAGAEVGFHAAYTMVNGAPAESGVANALVGSYLNSIGLPDEAVVYITAAPPEEIQWLTLGDARRLGIDVALLPPVPSERRQPSSTPSSPLPHRPSGNITLDQAARGFVEIYFGRWSENNAVAMTFVEGLYADQVDFYGSMTARQTIVELKRKFVERWPDRRYTVRPSSIKITCDQQASTCVIGGLVDWDCRNISRGARSAGLADFMVQVEFGASSKARVLGEAGSVILRSVGR